MVNEWEENIRFKVLHSRVIDFSSSGPVNHSSCRSCFLDHYINIRLRINFPPISYEKYYLLSVL
jgi:hypothetical protein